MRKPISKLNTRGNVAEGWIGMIIAIAVGIFSVAAVLLGLNAFGESVPNGSDAEQVIDNAETFAVNATDQLPTVGTLLGVALLIAVVAGGGIYAYDRYTRRG